jgi:hypothetical protein
MLMVYDHVSIPHPLGFPQRPPMVEHRLVVTKLKKAALRRVQPSQQAVP